MTVRVRIPTALRTYANGQANVEFDGVGTVDEALQRLTKEYPDLKTHLLDDQGRVRQFVNVYVNREDVREKNGLETPVSDGDTVLIVPSVAGGASTTRTNPGSSGGVAGG